MKIEDISTNFVSIEERLFNLTLLVDDYILLYKLKESISDHYSFLHRVKHSLANYMILELYKLLHKNEKGSLIKFLNISINNFKAIEWPTEIKIDFLKNLAKRFEESKFLNIYNKVLIVRNKISAHSDVNFFNDGPNFNELKYLIQFLKEIINDIELNIFNSQIENEISDSHRAKFLIDNLEKYNELRNLILVNKTNNRLSIDIETLLKFV